MRKLSLLKRVTMCVMALFAVIGFNSVMGATVGSMIGFTPVEGALGGNAMSLLAMGFMPKGALPVGVFAEIWTGEMIKAFRTSKENGGWYDRIRSFDQYVNNDVIHFTELGGDPNVLVNNKTYPIEVEDLQDADKPISLDRFDTTATPVTDDELHACSYDKMASVQERHREALREKQMEKAIHAFAPSKKSDTTPVINKAGEKFTFADILAAKRACDKMKMPVKDRIMVLSTDHINDLLETEQKFKDHYNINQTEGKIARLYGFDIYEYDTMPYYTAAGVKVAFGGVPGESDKKASVFYHNSRVMKAGGSVKFYHSEAEKDPLHHRNLVNFRRWHIAMPLTEENSVGAIV